jgi:hypothetical protein
MTETQEKIDFPPAGVGLLGLPLDRFSSCRRGAARAPAVIRKLLAAKLVKELAGLLVAPHRPSRTNGSN